MNILLAYPSYPDTFWSFRYALNFISKKAAFPPLGLLTVASLLPENWDKYLVDLNVEGLKDEDILWADMVMISAMLVQKKSAREIIARSKRLGKRVVAGGPAFMAKPEAFEGVDHFVLDEAETTLPLFLDDLDQGAPKAYYTSKSRPDIQKTPVPMWSLIDVKDYATMSVQYSRGCPFNCEFCDIYILNGNKPRTKTAKQMKDELQALKDLGWKSSVFIVDDNFIGNKKNVKDMLPEVIKWQKENDYPFTLLTEASVNLAEDQYLMDLMSAANFNKVFLGIETPCVESLKECGKYQNTQRDLSESVRIIHQNGMQVMAGFIVGFDNDTTSIFDTQIKFIQKIGVCTAMVGILGAIPQTRLWHRLKSEGRLLNETSGDNTDGSINFIPKMGIDNLLEGYKKVVTTIYKPSYYYKRIYIFIKNYQPTAKNHITSAEFKALLKTFWKIGLFSRSSPYFWGLLIKTLLTRIKALPEAIELSIYGHHFERVAKKCKKGTKSLTEQLPDFSA